MSRRMGHFIAVVICLLSVAITWADILVNVNLNKPIHDVDEQFVSFSIPPELLFKSLDGPNKKILTKMAALLGPAYLKLRGDYFFPSDMKSSLKNPTQSIWSGFNRWTRAMNWTMVIPVQYTPLSWDPIDALRVLNNSNTVGIDNCIWQLGIDFGASRAADYVADLNTLDTMVDTFRPYVKNWKVIGAEVTAGSSPEETKRYIDMSKNVNSAFGWTQPAGYHIEENVNGYIYDKDLALKAIMEKKVPVWLSLPPNGPVSQVSNGYSSIEVSEAIRWAQTLGDAASTGFDAVFKPLTQEDVNAPNYSFFVTALFKKLMGNRVFPAKPVKRFTYSTKLYTHCANGISGGIAFMGVNTEDYPIKISARLSAKFTGSEVWQFVLTSMKGVMYLNNEELTLNSTLEPFVRIKHPNKPLAISMPPMSVGFWILPLANHEDCQFTELLSSFNHEAQSDNRQRRQTSSDRLLRKLILETSLTDQMKNRRRRDTTSNNLNEIPVAGNSNRITRRKRFILQETPASDLAPSTAILQLSLQDKNLKKRDDAHNWFKSLVLHPGVIPKVDWGLKRSRRAADFLTALFPKENLTPAKPAHRRLSALSTKQRFENEANIFKKVINEEVGVPEGDVHVKYITGSNGEEIQTKEGQEEFEEEKRPRLTTRDWPSEFYENIPEDKYRSKPVVIDAIPKSKNYGIADIVGPTSFMTRNQVEVMQKEAGKTIASQSKSDDRDKLESVFGTQYVKESKPTAHAEESEESDSLSSYLKASKVPRPWATGRRFRRTIDYAKLKAWQDNLITKDENVRPFSYIIPEMSEDASEDSDFGTDAKPGIAANVKSHVSKIFTVVKDHLSGFFNSLVN